MLARRFFAITRLTQPPLGWQIAIHPCFLDTTTTLISGRNPKVEVREAAVRESAGNAKQHRSGGRKRFQIRAAAGMALASETGERLGARLHAAVFYQGERHHQRCSVAPDCGVEEPQPAISGTRIADDRTDELSGRADFQTQRFRNAVVDLDLEGVTITQGSTGGAERTMLLSPDGKTAGEVGWVCRTCGSRLCDSRGWAIQHIRKWR